MIARSLLRSSALRLAGAFALIFALGGALMFAAFYWAVAGYAETAIKADLTSETRALLGDGGNTSVPELSRRISARTGLSGPFDYILTDSAGRTLAGNLPRRRFTTGFGEIAVLAPSDGREASDEQATIRVLVTHLPQGVLVVGKSTYAVHELREWMSQIAVWGAFGMALLAAAGGLLAGSVLARRLDRVNVATSRIMQGHLNERMPPLDLGAEFEALRENLNRMLDRLEASMDAMRHISSDIAHDLRTPLNRLRHRLEHARRHSQTVEAFQAATDQALAELDEALGVFAALLRIAQIEAGAVRASAVAVDAADVARRVFEAYQPVAEQAGHVLTLRTETAQVIVGDEDLLIQMLSNLVENAVVHAERPVRIALSVFEEDGRAVFAVDDDGSGIPAEDLGKVTRRFYRLDRSRNSPGSGLGLALVAAIAASHDADLSLRAEAPGLGVLIRFPRPSMDPPA